MIEQKFGKDTADGIRTMLNKKLKRKVLGA